MKQNYDSSLKTLRLEFPGDVLSTNVDSLRTELMAAIESFPTPPPWEVLELDLRSAQMIDSAGLNLIVGIIRVIDQRSRKTRALISNPNIQRTFLFTRLDRHLEMVKTAAAQ